MPLYDNAEKLIRGALSAPARGKKAHYVVIGYLTDAQLIAINAYRQQRKFEPIEQEVVFRGQHLYDSRIRDDGYTVEDVLKQIARALSSEACYVRSTKMTVLQYPTRRDDGYGNRVKDEAVLDCTNRYPKAELFSVIPRGDFNKPPKMGGGATVS